MEKYELIPQNGRKSFYGKAIVEVANNGDETLYSYGTPIIRRNNDGSLTRIFFEDCSHTTATHIKSFCGLNKTSFEKLE